LNTWPVSAPIKIDVDVPNHVVEVVVSVVVVGVDMIARREEAQVVEALRHHSLGVTDPTDPTIALAAVDTTLVASRLLAMTTVLEDEIDPP
jgi:hypothetical protein